jgi:phosphate transport system ATP-binding protein
MFPSARCSPVIGPSGWRKSTFPRSINRMNDLSPGAGPSGELLLDGEDVCGRGVDPVRLRRVERVCPRPNTFPALSVFDNAAAGLRLDGIGGDHAAVAALPALLDAVKHRRREAAARPSGG